MECVIHLSADPPLDIKLSLFKPPFSANKRRQGGPFGDNGPADGGYPDILQSFFWKMTPSAIAAAIL